MSNSTKRILALTLKKLLSKTPLDNITVAQLTDEAEVSRKTFYYHFHDIYDLVEWALVDDGSRMIKETLKTSDWSNGISSLFDYMLSNRSLILNIYHGINRSTIEKWLIQYLKPFFLALIEEYPESSTLDAEDKDFMCSLYSFGLSGLFLHWIDEGMTSDPQPIISRINRFIRDNPNKNIHSMLLNYV